jgi:hypothetical protein
VNRLPAVLLCLFLSASLGAFPLPPPLETSHLLGKGRPAGAPPIPLKDEFYALGWSRGSLLAALERRVLDSKTRSVRFRVYNLVEDKVLWEEEWPDWGEGVDPLEWWTDKESEIERVFTRFDLEPTRLQMGVFPLILDEEFYSLSLRSVKNSDDPAWIDDLEIAVHSTGRGLKTVRKDGGFWRWATLLGFVPSPFEGRVALVLLVQPAGWLGADQPLRFLITGLSLKVGFSKP